MEDTFKGINEPDGENFLQHVKRWDELIADRETKKAALASAVESLKRYRKVIHEDGHNLRAFDRAMKERAKPAEERDEEERAFAQDMRWLGFTVAEPQAGFDIDVPVSETEAQVIETKAYQDGLKGRKAETNPYPADSPRAIHWLEGWKLGASEREQQKPSKPKRGRPALTARPKTTRKPRGRFAVVDGGSAA